MRINVATALDDNYIKYTYTMILSLFENKRSEDDIYVYVLYEKLIPQNISLLRNLEELYVDCTIIMTPIDASRFISSLPVRGQWSMAMYYRLMLPELVEENITKIIYLDGDIIVNKSLDDLFAIDMEENVICACEDRNWVEEVVNKCPIATHIFNCGYKYFNSGVMLMNLNILRKKYPFHMYMETASTMLDKLYAPDQDLLNYMHMKETKIIDRDKYNVWAKQAYIDGFDYKYLKENVSIVHYATQKPWRGQFIHCNTEILWWDYAKKTPFYNDLVDDFFEGCLGDDFVYKTMVDLIYENKKLKEEVALRTKLNDKLLSMVESQNLQ